MIYNGTEENLNRLGLFIILKIPLPASLFYSPGIVVEAAKGLESGDIVNEHIILFISLFPSFKTV